MRDLEKILAKHGITGAERERSIERRAHYFGKTILAAAQKSKAAKGDREGFEPLTDALSCYHRRQPTDLQGISLRSR